MFVPVDTCGVVDTAVIPDISVQVFMLIFMPLLTLPLAGTLPCVDRQGKVGILVVPAAAAVAAAAASAAAAAAAVSRHSPAVCCSPSVQVLLQDKCTIARAPDGNGGMCV
jgi:hypothetical protein